MRAIIDDINAPWQAGYFDFVHIRGMSGSVSDWGKLYQTVLQHLNLGGVVELVELSWQPMSDDGTLAPDSALASWWPLFKRIGEKTGQTFAATELAFESITAGGFTNIEEVKFKVPIGPWVLDKKLIDWGNWNLLYLWEGLQGFFLRGLTKLDWTPQQVELYLVKVRKDLKDLNIHSYLYLRVVYGQKPEVSVIG
ncbi:hypothetical protein GE09DRAFT_980419 [Coniochaeta sp. 2T2.1]|nr:hypothetical protein GE09DRAFT_980419 [Coniochaeta sp. 2T2.1]